MSINRNGKIGPTIGTIWRFRIKIIHTSFALMWEIFRTRPGARGHAESAQRARAQEVLDYVARGPRHGQIGRSERCHPYGMAGPESHRRELRGGAHQLGRDRRLETPF